MKRTNPPSVEPADPSSGTSNLQSQPGSSAKEAEPGTSKTLGPPPKQTVADPAHISAPLGLAIPAEVEQPKPEPVTPGADKPEVTSQTDLPGQGASVFHPPSSVLRPGFPEDVPIPSILLEGDEPTPAADTGPGEKFATSPQPVQSPVPEVSAQLPESYGTGRLMLTSRDPKCLYAHWDVSPKERQEVESSAGRLMVRIHQENLDGPVVAEQELPAGRRHAFVPVEAKADRYVAQLGYYLSEGPWKALRSSATATSPVEPQLDQGPVQFATVLFPVSGGESTQKATRSSAPAPGIPFTSAPLSELIPEFPLVKTGLESPVVEKAVAAPVLCEFEAEEDASYPAMTSLGQSLPEPTWTPTRERVLAEMISRSILRQRRIGSAEFEALMRGELTWAQLLAKGEVSSMAAAGISSRDVAAVPPKQQPGFWLSVNAELVIYGATEPNSTVTIGGRPIQLRSDASFSYRFALPDGSYPLPVEAASASGDKRRAELDFYRATRYSGQVGAHPQDPELALPIPENLT